MILYGGTKEQVKKQLDCEHNWHGPCIDDLSRYSKCLDCFCLDRDFTNEEEYHAAIKERDNVRDDV